MPDKSVFEQEPERFRAKVKMVEDRIQAAPIEQQPEMRKVLLGTLTREQAIEEPAGRLTGRMFRVQGAVLACIPRAKLVEKFMPSEWRKLAGMPGNASKDDVADHASLMIRAQQSLFAEAVNDL